MATNIDNTYLHGVVCLKPTTTMSDVLASDSRNLGVPATSGIMVALYAVGTELAQPIRASAERPKNRPASWFPSLALDTKELQTKLCRSQECAGGESGRKSGRHPQAHGFKRAQSV